jgi:hypothetical protein
MSGSSPRAHPARYPSAGLSASSVRVVVEPDNWSRQFSGGGIATRRSPGGVRLTARLVIALVFVTSGLALFDLYLLLSGL